MDALRTFFDLCTKADSIHKEFNAAQNRVPIHTIRGMGGIGKTQTAIYYSYEFANEYDLVFWIRSESDASLTADYEALTQTLQLPVKTKAEQLVYVNIVNNWLMNTDKKWLLVFDNAESQEKIEGLLPSKGNGHILITSQSPNWKELGEDSQIRPFTYEEARDFIRKRLGEKDLEHSDGLNSLLGGLPLALEQACAYMAAHGTPIELYINLFEEQQGELWKRETPPKDYKSTIMTTWELAFKQIQETYPAAKQLLNLFAFFGPDDIPLSIIKNNSEYLPEELQKAISKPVELEENLSYIYRYSLVERKEKFVSFHRLVQDVIRTQLPKDKASKWVNTAVHLMNRSFPYDEYDLDTWKSCTQLLPHALAAANFSEKFGTGLEDGAEIYQKVGEFLGNQAEYKRASEAFEHAINIREEILGGNDKRLALSLNSLGDVRQQEAKYTEALRLHNRALQIFELTGSLPTQQGARNVNNLGQVFHYLGEFQKAKDCYEQAMRLYKTTLKEKHPDISMCLNNLGLLHKEQGEFENARTYYEESLSIRRETLERNHPDIAMSLNNLGLLFRDQGDIENARKYLEEALLIRRIALGENHPDTAICLNNLGLVFQDQGEIEVARKHYDQAYTIDFTVFGENHPNTATDLHNIGSVLFEQSKYVEARRHLEQALAIWEKVFGSNHHKLLLTLGSLANVMLKLKLYPLARRYIERAVKICSESKFRYQDCGIIDELQKSISLINKPQGKKRRKY